MLIISRQPGESIAIGDNNIRITVTHVDHGKVRIGFEAPGMLEVWREEVLVQESSARRPQKRSIRDRKQDE